MFERDCGSKAARSFACGVSPLRASLGLHATCLSSVSRADERQSREEGLPLQSLAAVAATSLILDRRSPSTPVRPSPRPVVVEKRSLAAICQIFIRRNCQILNRR